MKYFLIEIIEGDSKIAGKSVYEYADRTQALASFHSELGKAMKSVLYTSIQIMMINSVNGVEASEVFERPVVVEEPEI